jgi:hypothetical protein
MTASRGLFGGRRFVIVVLGLAALAAEPQADLLRFVPSDVGFCVVLNDLRGHSDALTNSPFVAGLEKSPAAKTIAHSVEIARLAGVEKHFQEVLGPEWPKVLDDVFGDMVVYAYRPGPPDKPSAEQGLFLLRARNEKSLVSLIDRINDLQTKSKEISGLEKKTHRGVTYLRRLESDEKSNYYLLRGPVLVLTGQEAMLKQAIDLDLDTPRSAEPAAAEQLRLLGVEKSFIALWVNPRAFDAHLAARAASAATPDEVARHKAVHSFWAALDAVALAFDLDRDVGVTLTLRGDPAKTAAAWRRVMTQAARASDLWRAFPEDALFAAAGRVDCAALYEVTTALLPDEGRQAVTTAMERISNTAFGGRDLLKEILPAVGPDVGVCVVAPPSEAKGWFPLAVAALRINAGADAAQPVDVDVLAAMDALARLFVFDSNQKRADHPFVLKKANGVRFVAADGVLPPGVRPSFGLNDGFLLAGSSPEALAVVRDGLRGSAATVSDAPTPIVRVSLKSWRRFLKERREPLTHALAEKNGITVEAAGREIDGILFVLGFADRIDLSCRSRAERASLTLSVTPTLPFKKD